MTELNLSMNSAMELQLPWSSSQEQDEKFRKLLIRILLLLLLLFLVFPWLPLPEISREEAEKLPPQLARVILEEPKPVEPPPPPVEEKRPEKEPVVEESPVNAPKKVQPKPAPKPAPTTAEVQKAREKVASIGVNAAASQLSSLRSSLNVAALAVKNDNVSSGGAKETARSVLGSKNATATSGGLKASDVSTDLGSGKLAGKNSQKVDGNIDLGGAGSAGNGNGDGEYASNRLTGRDMESIRRVFEAEKGAIYSLYTRALRKDPNLQGRFVFELVIKPDGSVADLKLVESELGDANLEKRILARIRLIRFGAADVADTPVNYKFDFLPG